MNLLLIRHAEINGDPFVCPQQPVTGCLSERGVKQAAALSEYINKDSVDIVFSSPFGRALQTAETVMKGREKQIKILECLKEWEPNRNLSTLPSTEYEELCRNNRNKYAEEIWKTDLGEGCYDMYARIIPPFLSALAGIGVRAGCGGFILGNEIKDKTIAVFAHGGSLSVILSFFLRIPPFPVNSFRFAKTGVAELIFVEQKNIYYPVLSISSPSAE